MSSAVPRLGYRVGSVDVEHLDRRGGQATGAAGVWWARSLADLGRLWWEVTVSRSGRRTPTIRRSTAP